MIPFSLAAMLLVQGPVSVAPLDAAYRQMYNLEFAGAHRTLSEWERLRPDDPLGPASNAAAYLFAEFDRLRILQSEFFTDDDAFKRRAKLSPDPAARRAFDAEMEKAARIAGEVLARSPGTRMPSSPAFSILDFAPITTRWWTNITWPRCKT